MQLPELANRAVNIDSPDNVGEQDPASKVGIPRVGSLDYLRAFLHSRPPGAGPLDENNVSTALSGLKEDPFATLGGVAAAAAESNGVNGPIGLQIAQLFNPLVPPGAFINGFNLASGASTGSVGNSDTVQAALNAALALGQVPPAMLPYIAAMNAAAMVTQIPVTAVPAPAVGGGSEARAVQSGYSSGDGNATATAIGKRGVSSDGAGDKVQARRERRMLSNRESARRSRKRKQEHLAEMEQQLAAIVAERGEMEARMSKLQEEVSRQRTEVSALRAQNEALQRKLDLSAATVDGTSKRVKFDVNKDVGISHESA